MYRNDLFVDKLCNVFKGCTVTPTPNQANSTVSQANSTVSQANSTVSQANPTVSLCYSKLVRLQILAHKVEASKKTLRISIQMTKSKKEIWTKNWKQSIQ